MISTISTTIVWKVIYNDTVFIITTVDTADENTIMCTYEDGTNVEDSVWDEVENYFNKIIHES